MKEVKLTHAEVICFYGTNDVIKEVVLKDNKGIIVNFNIKTRINDRVANSPLIFEECSYFATAEQQTTRIKEIIKLGSIIDISGTQDRRSYKDKQGKMKYKDSVRVTEISPIQIPTSQDINSSPTDEGCPF